VFEERLFPREQGGGVPHLERDGDHAGKERGPQWCATVGSTGIFNRLQNHESYPATILPSTPITSFNCCSLGCRAFRIARIAR